VAATANADVVIGSRYIPGGDIVNWPLKRRLLSRFANVYIRTVTHLGARDCTSGYRCWRRDALAALPLDRFFSDGYSFLVEMLFVASRRGCRIAEVPITFVERREGESKVSTGVLLESAITPWRLIASPELAKKTAPPGRHR
ncbi:MAG: polyprenol monophosphomannose synthase, partial [Vicinamibacterales bacterium]